MDMSLSKLQELVIDMEAWCAQSMGSQGVRHDSATELNWTERDHAGSHQVCKYPFCGGMSHVGPRPGRCMEENFMSLLTDTGEGNGNPLQYSCLENPMGGGAWWAAVHGVVKSRTWLRDFTFTFHFPALEKEMATHSSVLAWRIPGMGEPGELPSIGSHRVGHDWSDLAAAAENSTDLPAFAFHLSQTFTWFWAPFGTQKFLFLLSCSTLPVPPAVPSICGALF